MGITKELMLEEQEREAIAEDLAVEAGILKRCPWHERVYQEDWDLERVYRMAAWRFKRGEVSGRFYSQRDLTDAIKAVVEDAPLVCLHCEKMRNED
jgi:hypothetical protein